MEPEPTGAAPDPTRIYGGRVAGAAYRAAGFAARTWTRLDPDGWFRPGYAVWLAGQTATGPYTVRGAWAAWCNNPRQNRYSRRRSNAVRRFRRMDGSAAAWAVAAGRLTRRVRRRSDGTAAAHVHPWWPLRRAGVAWFLARSVARGEVRASALPDAWTVACAAADGIDPIPRTYGRHGRAVPDQRRR